ncbi:3-deoxy-D-manno-octulosonic acid kinase [Basilea psittacipulmonis]|uniref:3-deoxy-D-manno-octulosonic acid kinase n=1 Tax=Basilea psittacipulmonis DSM 24701 TaxID=1072685 RepID=A0A077DDU9_9BURK|nr:3-deoxy-D-manno-octulosonic acid kinase [Basilea psittacipulmonis]AIL32306.1 hypothetical protein IX83_02325 [Basilea psittacipulmonis DSM 24701]
MNNIQFENETFLLNTQTLEYSVQQMFCLDFWKKEKRILGHAKGRGITWFLKSADLFGVDTALRHYYRGGLIGKLNRDLFLYTDEHKTRSFAEFNLLKRLHELGLAVPKPIAARMQKVGGIFYRADILLEKIDGASDLTVLLKTSLPELVWERIGQEIKKLHQAQVNHRDLNCHNILIQSGTEKIYLIDFDKCAIESGERWKEENLLRLKRSFEKEKQRMGIVFDDACWMYLLKGYERV